MVVEIDGHTDLMCPKCFEIVPHGANACPKCGHSSGRAEDPLSDFKHVTDIEARGTECQLCGSQWYIRYDVDTNDVIECGCGNSECENFLPHKWG